MSDFKTSSLGILPTLYQNIRQIFGHLVVCFDSGKAQVTIANSIRTTSCPEPRTARCLPLKASSHSPSQNPWPPPSPKPKPPATWLKKKKPRWHRWQKFKVLDSHSFRNFRPKYASWSGSWRSFLDSLDSNRPRFLRSSTWAESLASSPNTSSKSGTRTLGSLPIQKLTFFSSINPHSQNPSIITARRSTHSPVVAFGSPWRRTSREWHLVLESFRQS